MPTLESRVAWSQAGLASGLVSLSVSITLSLSGGRFRIDCWYSSLVLSVHRPFKRHSPQHIDTTTDYTDARISGSLNSETTLAPVSSEVTSP